MNPQSGHEFRKYDMDTFKTLHRNAHLTHEYIPVEQEVHVYDEKGNFKGKEIKKVPVKTLVRKPGYIPLRQFIREFDLKGREARGKAAVIRGESNT